MLMTWLRDRIVNYFYVCDTSDDHNVFRNGSSKNERPVIRGTPGPSIRDSIGLVCLNGLSSRAGALGYVAVLR